MSGPVADDTIDPNVDQRHARIHPYPHADGEPRAALVLGYLTQRLGLSPIVGYLLAGVLVGPHTPGFVADAALAEELAEIGVILLMFGVGLQFHLEELLAVRRVAVPGAIAQMPSPPFWARWSLTRLGGNGRLD